MNFEPTPLMALAKVTALDPIIMVALITVIPPTIMAFIAYKQSKKNEKFTKLSLCS